MGNTDDATKAGKEPSLLACKGPKYQALADQDLMQLATAKTPLPDQQDANVDTNLIFEFSKVNLLWTTMLLWTTLAQMVVLSMVPKVEMDPLAIFLVIVVVLGIVKQMGFLLGLV